MEKISSLTPIALQVIHDKGTEPPYSGDYESWDKPGTYLCRCCGLALFRSQSKFHSRCGWPSFDEEIMGHVVRKADSDGKRTEILCARCQGHLGHVFSGEGFTEKNQRFCVNSISLDFVASLGVDDTEEAIFAAGCFWGVEYYFKKLDGVLATEVGYSGGDSDTPDYKTVCTGRSGYFEVVRVIYDPEKLDYATLARYFFEIHDPTQTDGQGPDKGEQYSSVVFYYNAKQQHIAEELIQMLRDKHYSVATKVLPVKTFWPAESYHQDYYTKEKKQPYCHHYQKRF